MTQLHPVDIVENKVATAVGWFVSLPVAFCLFGSMMWLIGSLPWKIGIGMLVIPFGSAALGLFISRAVQQWLIRHWKSAVHNKVAEPTVVLSRVALWLGDSFQVTYRQQILQAVEIKQFAIQLVRRTRKVYHRNAIVIQETTEKKRERVVQTIKQPGGSFQPKDTFQQEVTLTIPNNEVPTSQAGDRYEEWLLRVRVAMVGGPAFVSEYPLQVIAESVQYVDATSAITNS